MRKITTAILLIFCCTGNVLARATNTTCKQETYEDCRNTPGCYWTSFNKCAPCPEKTFCTGGRDDAKRYSSCDPDEYHDLDFYNGEKPIYIYLISIDTQYELSKDHIGAEGPHECAVTITCPAGTGLYWDGQINSSISCTDCSLATSEEDTNPQFSLKATTHNIDKFDDNTFEYNGCESCGANSSIQSTTTGCFCYDNYHTKGKNNDYTNNNHTDCVADRYPIYIYESSDNTDTPTNEDKVAYVTHDLGSYENDSSDTFTTIGDAIEYTGLTFTKTGYHQIARGNNNIYHIEDNWNIEANIDDNATPTLNDQITSQSKDQAFYIYPKWTVNTFSIKYAPGEYSENNNATFADFQKFNDQSCTYGANCKISDDIPTAANESYVFIGWKITGINSTNTPSTQIKVSNKTISNAETIQPGALINNATTENNGIITLTAQWQACHAGYYDCEISEQDGLVYACKCPAGSTSNPGATSINDCFITNDTQFCTGDNCFTLNISNTYRTTGSDCTDKVKVPDTTN